MDEIQRFSREVTRNIQGLAKDQALAGLSNIWIRESARHRYSYNFTWLGRPIIQYPQDILAVQEIIWNVKPDLIIETGIAHGGSLILSASLLELLGGEGQVLGIDIEIRKHNRKKIEEHPVSKRISMIEGSSVDRNVFRKVERFAMGKKRIVVFLDSNHTHRHVLRELNLYSKLVTRGSYLVVFDTVIEDLPEDFFPHRPWGKGNSPKTAVWKFLEQNKRFVIDRRLESKLLITVAPDGYLKRIR